MKGVFTIAKPILEELRVPATIFLTGHFLRGDNFWWDLLASIVCAKSAAASDLRLAAQDEDKLRRTLIGNYEALRKVTPAARNVSLERMERDLGLGVAPRFSQMMSETQARSLPSGLLDVGSHTMTYPRLTELTKAEAGAEIVESKRDLETFFGRPVWAFSYPFGLVDEGGANW